VSALHAGRETDDLLHATDVDLAGLLPAVAEALERRPLLIQYGGFAPGDERLLSRGESLFSRSLQQVGHQVVTVGWPVSDSGRPTMALHDLRHELTRFGFEHRYPLTAAEPDPDAHMVLGDLEDHVPAGLPEEVLAEARLSLSELPCQVTLRPEQLRVVFYDDPRLPRDSTASLTLGEAAHGTAPTGDRPDGRTGHRQGR